MVRHYMLSSEDLALINRRRGDPNRLGFALTLCYLPAAPQMASPDSAVFSFGQQRQLGAGAARIEEERNAGSNQDTGQRAGK